MNTLNPALPAAREAVSTPRLGVLLRWWLLGGIVVGLTLLAGLNWTALNTVLPLNLVLLQVQWPMGLMLLALSGALLLLGLLSLGLVRGSARPESAQVLKELRLLRSELAQLRAAQAAHADRAGSVADTPSTPSLMSKESHR